jgi:outer membrane protein assembly factor BamD (BamD/ComL family)
MRKILMLLLILVIALVVACSNKEESARKMHNKALTLQQNKQYDEADKIFQEIIRKYPETQTAVEVNKKILEQRKAQEFLENIAKEKMKELFGQALDQFRLDNGRYPTTEEGLEALFENKSNLYTWDGPYLKSPKYINEFTYRTDGSEYVLNIK